MKNWYSIQAKANNAPPEISIYDDIGAWGITAKNFIGDLKAIDAKKIKLAISSNGGSVFDALAMYNALRQHAAEIEVTVMGVAASAASLVAMAGDKIFMPENAFMMVHNPLIGTYGNSEDLREMADVLDKIGESLISTYVARTGKTREEIKDLLDAETWLNAEDAVAMGFADELQPAMKVAASFDLDRLPENIRASITPPAEPENEPENEGEPEDDHPLNAAPSLSASILAKASAAGISMHADALIIDAAIQTEADVDAAIAEAREIIAVCKAGKLPDAAAPLIAARVPLAAVRNRMLESRAALDKSMPINNHLPTPNNAGQTAADVWAKVLPPKRQTKE